jgi:menaquinone-dependent protoporphyrinogen IX oxidase
MKTLIVCASRYGSTLEIGRWMADRLPWSEVAVVPVEEAPAPDGYELVFIGGGVYNEQVDKNAVQYAESHLAGLEGKKIAAFAVCLDTKGVFMKGEFYGGWQYLKPLLEVLKPVKPIYAGALSGEINPQKLSDEDREKLMFFYTKILKRDISEVPFRTAMNKPEVWEFVEKTMARLEGRF